MFFSQYIDWDMILDYSPSSLGVKLFKMLRDAVVKVKRARRWFLVDPLTRAFSEAYTVMKFNKVKSMVLMRAIVKTLKELKEVISEEAKLIKIGLKEAWKMSELASSWGHSTSRNWKDNKYFIIWQALTLKWISRLFGGFATS